MKVDGKWLLNEVIIKTVHVANHVEAQQTRAASFDCLPSTHLPSSLAFRNNELVTVC